jgi:hypothetical protein
MGRTIPSYRIATEIEKAKWKPFREMLNRKDKKLFDEMLCYPQLYNSAGSNAVRPVLLEPILMSIVFEHYKQLKKMEDDLSISNDYSSFSSDSASDCV